MKILFIVQGEGRGHLTQAISLEEILRRNGHEVVEVLVGKSNYRHLPGFFNCNIQSPIKRFLSPNFLPTPANQRVNVWRSVLYNIIKIPVYLRSVYYIYNRIENSEADLVVNFYEILTGMTYFLFRPSVPQISIGHQYLFLHHEFEFPPKNSFSLLMLRFFTRLTCIGAVEKLALSFIPMKVDNKARIRVVPPLLRQEVLCCEATAGDYLHGYIVNAGFGQCIIDWHRKNPDIPLHFFWDKPEEEDTCKIDETLTFHQLNDTEFLRYMAGCKSYATTAGFESVCEAMYLGKPILMVPAHIEQDCNAYDAERAGAGIVSNHFDLNRLSDFETKKYKPLLNFKNWARGSEWQILNIIEAVNNSSYYRVHTLGRLMHLYRYILNIV